MDFLFLLALLLLAFPIIAIVALVMAIGLRDQLRRTQARLALVEGRLATSPPAPHGDQPREMPAEPVPPPPVVEALPAVEPRPQPQVPPEPRAHTLEREPSPASASAPPPQAAAAPASMSLEERL